MNHVMKYNATLTQNHSMVTASLYLAMALGKRICSLRTRNARSMAYTPLVHKNNMYRVPSAFHVTQKRCCRSISQFDFASDTG